MFGFLVYCIYQRGARTDFDSNVLDTNCNCSKFDLSTSSESQFYLVHCSTYRIPMLNGFIPLSMVATQISLFFHSLVIWRCGNSISHMKCFIAISYIG